MFRLQYVLLFPITIIELFLIWVYRICLRYALPRSCNFIPTCSKYAFDSIKEFGAILGTYYAIKRLSRCRPNHSSGYDFTKLNIQGNYKWKC